MSYQLRDKNAVRLCIVSPLFHPNSGGPGRQATTMAVALKERGISFLVIARKLDMDFTEHDFEIHYIRTPMPEQYTLVEFTFINLLIAFSFSFGALLRLLALRKRYDIVQFYGGGLPLLVCLPFLKMLGKKTVVKLSGANRGLEVGNLEGSALKPLLSCIFSLADKFIPTSDELRQGLLAAGVSEHRIVKIPNGVDTKIFYSYDFERKEDARKDVGVQDKRVFAYSGQLVKGKGLDTLINAMKIIADQYKEAYLILIGDGILREELEKRAASLGISDNIVFKGKVAAVCEFLNMADAFVFPSFREGMPNSLLEAMACGLPCIASRIGGVVDVIEDGKSGILFEPGNVPELVSAMIRLVADEKLRKRLGDEARKRIGKSFSIDSVADEYVKLYETLMVNG